MKKNALLILLVVLALCSTLMFSCSLLGGETGGDTPSAVTAIYKVEIDADDDKGVKAGKYTVDFELIGIEEVTAAGLEYTIDVSVKDIYGNTIEVDVDDEEYEFTVQRGATYFVVISVTLSNEQVFTKNMQVTAVSSSSVVNHTVSFMSTEGGIADNPVYADQSIQSGYLVTKPVDPVLEGYTFAYWYVYGETPKAYDFSRAVSQSITLRAKWVPIDYTVHFDSNEGQLATGAVADIVTNVTNGYTVAKFPAVTRTGYTLSGWYYLDNDGTSQQLLHDTPVRESITVTAAWTINTYDIKYFDGTTLLAANEIGATLTQCEYGQTIDLSDLSGITLTKTGYMFDGIGLKDDNGDVRAFTADDSITVDSDVEFFAVWTKVVYTVSFVTNSDGAIPDIDDQYVSVNTLFKVSAPIIAEHITGRDFDDWYVLGATDPFDFDSAISHNTIIEARWIPREFSVSFMNGDELLETELTTALYDEKISLPDDIAPTKEGHRLLGYKARVASNTVEYETFPYQVKRDVIFDAVWEIITYSAEFDLAGGSPNGGGTTIPVQYTDYTRSYKITAPSPQPIRQGYTFDGWFYNDSLFNFPTMTVPEDITLTAKWTIREFEVTFRSCLESEEGTDGVGVFEGNRYSIISFGTINGTPLPSVEPTRDGCVFAGWHYIDSLTDERVDFTADTPVLGIMKVYPYWNTTMYDVTFHTEHGSFENSSTIATTKGCIFGTDIPNLNVTGYTIEGWSTDADTMLINFDKNTQVLADIDVYAVLSKEEYIVRFFDEDTELASLKKTIEFEEQLTLPAVPTTKAGYEADGWYYMDGEQSVSVQTATLSVAQNTDLYIKWDLIVIDVSVTLVTTSSTLVGPVFKTDITQGNTFSAEELRLAVRDSEFYIYNFDGWYSDAECLLEIDFSTATFTSNTTIYAKVSAKQPTIYYFDDMTLEGVPVVNPTKDNFADLIAENKHTILATKNFGETIAIDTELPAIPAYRGYKSQGWYLFNSNGEQGEVTGNRRIDSDFADSICYVYANYSYITATINFDSKGGADVPHAVLIILDDFSMTAPTPTRTGYKFEHWYKIVGTGENAREEIVSFAEPIIDLDTPDSVVRTFYAKWSLTEYDITFNAAGGVFENDTATNVQKGSVNGVVLPDTPDYPGYIFDGWFVEDTTFDPTLVVTAAMSVTAKWHKGSYDVTFTYPNEHTEVRVGNVDGVDFPDEPQAATGYFFNGWYTSGNVRYTPTTPITQNTTLRAVFETIKIVITFVTVNTDSSAVITTTSTATILNNYLISEQAVSRDNYVLDGWYETISGDYAVGANLTFSNKFNFFEQQSTNKTVYAKWRSILSASSIYTHKKYSYDSTTNKYSPSESGDYVEITGFDVDVFNMNYAPRGHVDVAIPEFYGANRQIFRIAEGAFSPRTSDVEGYAEYNAMLNTIRTYTLTKNIIIGDSAFANNSAIESLILPDTTGRPVCNTTMLWNATKLTNIFVPLDSLTLYREATEANAFYDYNDYLSTIGTVGNVILVQDDVTYMVTSESAIVKSVNATAHTVNLVIPAYIVGTRAVSSLANHAMNGVKGSLLTVDLPSTLTAMRYDAFADCAELKTITLRSTVPPVITHAVLPEGTQMPPVFANCNPELVVYVPAEALSTYLLDAYWSQFTLAAMPLD